MTDTESGPILSGTFQSIPNKQLDSFYDGSYSQSFYAKSLVACISKCLTNQNCVLISFKSAECKLYEIINYQYLIDSPTTSLYKKQGNIFDKLMLGLQNYWPIINRNVDDRIGVAHMYCGVNASFTNDRFNNSNSAIDLNDGYYSIPPGEYVCGDFTFSAWAYIRNQLTYFNRFIDLGNGAYADNIVIAYSQAITKFLFMFIMVAAPLMRPFRLALLHSILGTITLLLLGATLVVYT